MYKISTPKYLSFIGVEIWKPVVGYEGLYEVSNLGKVVSIGKTLKRKNGVNFKIRKRVLKQYVSKAGYLNVTLHKNASSKPCNVHSLVIEAFKGKAPPNNECRHLDGNKLNPSLYNLKWGTRKQNVGDTVKHGRNYKPQGELHLFHILKEKDVLKIRKLHGEYNYTELAEMYNVSKYTIYDVVNRRTWRHI